MIIKIKATNMTKKYNFLSKGNIILSFFTGGLVILAVLHIFDHLQTMHLVNKFMVVLDYCRNTLSYY